MFVLFFNSLTVTSGSTVTKSAFSNTSGWTPRVFTVQVHLQVLRVVDFGRVGNHLGLPLPECPNHHVQRGVNVNV